MAGEPTPGDVWSWMEARTRSGRFSFIRSAVRSVAPSSAMYRDRRHTPSRVKVSSAHAIVRRLSRSVVAIGSPHPVPWGGFSISARNASRDAGGQKSGVSSIGADRSEAARRSSSVAGRFGSAGERIGALTRPFTTTAARMRSGWRAARAAEKYPPAVVPSTTTLRRFSRFSRSTIWRSAAFSHGRFE